MMLIVPLINLQVALPELDGGLEPIVFAGRDSATGKSHSLPDRIASLTSRAIKWAQVREETKTIPLSPLLTPAGNMRGFHCCNALFWWCNVCALHNFPTAHSDASQPCACVCTALQLISRLKHRLKMLFCIIKLGLLSLPRMFNHLLTAVSQSQI